MHVGREACSGQPEIAELLLGSFWLDDSVVLRGFAEPRSTQQSQE